MKKGRPQKCKLRPNENNSFVKKENLRGPNYFEMNNFARFQENINSKASNQQKKQSELADLEQEITILKRTEAILNEKMKESVKEVRVYESKYGLTGLLNIDNDLEELTKKKGNIDQIKGKTLEELTVIVESLNNKIEEKRDSLKPLVEEHKTLKAQIKELEDDHKQKQSEFERVN